MPVAFQIACGGGDPADRDPEKVRMDVVKEFISVEMARDMCKVVIDPVTLEVDQKKTATLRGQKPP